MGAVTAKTKLQRQGTGKYEAACPKLGLTRRNFSGGLVPVLLRRAPPLMGWLS